MHSDESVEKFIVRAIKKQGGKAKFTGARQLTIEAYNVQMVLNLETIKVIEKKV